MEKHVELGYLLDCYGALLTERQRSLIAQSVNEDYSLSEIAEQEGISRQGVRDSIKRGEDQLYELEEKLGILASRSALVAGLNELMAVAGSVPEDEIKRRIYSLLEICEYGV